MWSHQCGPWIQPRTARTLQLFNGIRKEGATQAYAHPDPNPHRARSIILNTVKMWSCVKTARNESMYAVFAQWQLRCTGHFRHLSPHCLLRHSLNAPREQPDARTATRSIRMFPRLKMHARTFPVDVLHDGIRGTSTQARLWSYEQLR